MMNRGPTTVNWAREHTAELGLQPVRQVDISVNEPFQNSVSEEWLAAVVDRALDVALASGEPGQVSLVLTDDATVQELNREFRGLDEVTDVLSFSAAHPGAWEGDAEAPVDRLIKSGDSADVDFVLPPGELPPLGEVIISFPQARRQARQRNSPALDELALLIVHGILHLVGHDHVEPEETAKMKAGEQAALSALFQAGTDINGTDI